MIREFAKSFAIKLDVEALAADCAVTEEKANTNSVANSQNKWTLASSSTTKTYWASCHLEEGMTEKALAAKSITVQLAMTNGTTKPHKLNKKELRKFQTLDK